LDGERFDGLARALQYGRPTRRALAKPLVSLALGFGFGAQPTLVPAKKGKKRKKCKKAKPTPTCPGACPDNCVVCAARHAGTPICGHNVVWNCGHVCTSDNDCIGKIIVGVAIPYCITGYSASGDPFTPLPCGGTSHCAGLFTCT
jgi:hypothetical protein